MPKTTKHSTSPASNAAGLTPEQAVVAAARRVVLAHANPDLDWGKTSAMQEESDALDQLEIAVKALVGTA